MMYACAQRVEQRRRTASICARTNRRRRAMVDEKLLYPRTGTITRPVVGSEKLGTFSGVFVPTSLNVLSILMFIRWGFILGQGGVVGMMGMLIVAYLINLVTTMSISAVASNGTVRGGGAYYLISRSLGTRVRWQHWDCFLSWMHLQYGNECRGID